MKKIGIIFAMEEELNGLKEIIDIKKISQKKGLTFYESVKNKNEIILVESGVGKVHSARTTQLLIDEYNPDYIFNIGVAGGISNIVNVNDIVIATSLVQHDFDITAFDHPLGYVPKVGVNIESDKNLIGLAKSVIKDIKYHEGIIATGDIFCTDKEISKKINKDFNALCVEMEGASIAQVSYLNNIPFLVIRSISDTLENDNLITYEEFLEDSCQKVAYIMNEVLNNI